MANIVFSLEVLPAMQGDCMLLRYGPKANNKQKLALIDAGPSGVYAKHLKPRLMKLRAEKGVPDEEPMVLDWVMVSHVDDDHVNGLVQLTEELKALPANRFVKPARLWHNCFDDVIGNDATELRKAARTFGTASLTGDISLDAVPAEAQVDAATFADALMVLAGIGQGVDLRDNAKVLEIPVNADGKGGLTVARADGKPIDMGGGLTFIVIGPMLDEVKALQEEHRKWLEEQKKKPKPPAGALAAYIDPSVTNLSSIVVLAELGGKKILFTGDARGDKILGGMKHVGLGDRLHVDVLKSQHHGSDNNATQDFFERVTADHYVFSGNGGHGNPERETFDMLRKARPGASYSIYLTYEIDAIDVLREKDWEQKRKARQRRGNEPGPAWSAAKQGLAAFFKKHPDMKNRVVPLKGDVPRHRIDLLERL